MEYIYLGNSGLRVPKYILGTVPFSGTNGFEAAGDIKEDQARRMVDLSLEAGINMFDTANLYSKGDAERVLGAAIKGRREDVLLTSKTGFPLSDNPNNRGASRNNILASIDQTLERLGTDYLDLYFTHLWDGQTPVEETVEAMTSLVKAGKVRHWGVSNYSGWALARTYTVAEQNGFIPPVTQQIYYSPEAREAEYELLPAGAELGVSSMIWSALGEGLLNGKIGRNKQTPENTRQGGGWPEPWIQDQERLYQVIDALEEVAANHNTSVPQIAYAWVRDRPNVGPIVIAARNEEQLKENIASFDIQLSQEEQDRIETVARPLPIYPNWHRAMNSLELGSPSEITYLKGYKQTMGIEE
ncbi:aldo/keto reductase [Planococcus glaciei]|uniref:Aldo/keto reductase n=1 Tax=Planococcus glaciei TaxID=459472 RepID=A0A7H8QBW8_9BACL|nr:aldo/keto reductase [Planococcus glaciei]QDY46093.1 aldo/keto reductase [Planococcus glaciei]QKX51457.1 aldo/keto reductase [Planococcus glaciei]